MSVQRVNWYKGRPSVVTVFDPVSDCELRQKAMDLLREMSETEEFTMFNEELKFFIANQEELVRKYKGKTLVIKGACVLGAYSSALEAYSQTLKTHKAGSFMLQPCTAGANAYTVTINSNNIMMR